MYLSSAVPVSGFLFGGFFWSVFFFVLVFCWGFCSCVLGSGFWFLVLVFCFLFCAYVGFCVLCSGLVSVFCSSFWFWFWSVSFLCLVFWFLVLCSGFVNWDSVPNEAFNRIIFFVIGQNTKDFVLLKVVSVQ